MVLGKHKTKTRQALQRWHRVFTFLPVYVGNGQTAVMRYVERRAYYFPVVGGELRKIFIYRLINS